MTSSLLYTFLIIIIIIILILILNNILKNRVNKLNEINELFIGKFNCLTNDGKIGYKDTNDATNICKSIEELLASPSQSNNSQILNINPNLTDIIGANDYCNNLDDASGNKTYPYGLKEYIIDPTVPNGSPNIRAVCQDGYPKTYISSSSIQKKDVTSNYCQTKFTNQIGNNNNYGIKEFLYDQSDTNYNTVYPICAEGYTFIPCSDNSLNFDDLCKLNSPNGKAGLHHKLFDFCGNNAKKSAAICSNNTFGMMKRVNSSVFTDCKSYDADFQTECNKLVMADNNTIYNFENENSLNITGLKDSFTTNPNSVKGLKTFPAEIDSYDCGPNQMRAKCITKNDINNVGNDLRKKFGNKENIYK